MSERPAGLTKATFRWQSGKPKHDRTFRRLCELVAMSKQPGGMKRAIARMRAGDQAVEQRRWVVG